MAMSEVGMVWLLGIMGWFVEICNPFFHSPSRRDLCLLYCSSFGEDQSLKMEEW